MQLSRRTFLSISGGLWLVDPLRASAHPSPVQDAAAAATGITAATIVDRIKANVGIPWLTDTVDRIVAGAPDTPVRGVATTMMATLDVLKRADAAGRNMIISHEPTFYSHQDRTEAFATDATFRFKDEFVRNRGLIVFHFHDHWHRRTPDGIARGMARELGWERDVVPGTQNEFALGGRTVLEIARHLQSRLGGRSSMRIVGHPDLKVNRALASWGYVSLGPGTAQIARPDVDLLIGGETREWEVVEYVQDQIAAGRQKALIVLGHVISEQAGMKLCAEWLKTFINDVPVDFVPAAEPFWRVQP